METLEQIKQAVLDGKTVYWKNPAYQVEQDSKNPAQWWVKCTANNNYSSLFWADNVTSDYKPEDFFIVPATITEEQITEGAKFLCSNGLIWNIDSIIKLDDTIVVRASIGNGAKGIYRDTLLDTLLFLINEGAELLLTCVIRPDIREYNIPVGNSYVEYLDDNQVFYYRWKGEDQFQILTNNGFEDAHSIDFDFNN